MFTTLISQKIHLPEDQLGDFCRRWQITEFAFFGSVLREDFHAGSDIDILVRFASNADWSLLDHVQMERELSDIVGRKVELVSRRAIEGSKNWIRRRDILSTARTIYAS